MEIKLEDVLRVFATEAEEHFAAMEHALMQLEAQPQDEELLRGLFRDAHTLKGAAACVGLSAVAGFAHGLEDFLERLWKRELGVCSAVITDLLRAIDLGRALMAPGATDALTPAHSDLLARLAQHAGRAHEPPKSAGDAAGQAATRRRTLRVAVEQLDKLVDLAGEIAIARGRLTALLERGDAALLPAMRDAHEEGERLYLEMHECIMKLRMLPVGPTFRQHTRTVRDVAVACGKQARLIVEGEDVELDLAVLEALRDPLLHLVRNAVDHGLELPELRRAAGKDPTGTVALRARYAGGAVEVEVADDGTGLDHEKIARRARARGLLPADAPLADRDVVRLIFAPGFSTAERVTEVSGRGIGLDVVSRNVESLRGHVSVESIRQRGATVRMRVPLTLAMIQAFAVGIDDEVYLLPLEAVSECLQLPAGAGRDEAAGVLNVRGRPLPYARLHHLLGAPDARRERQSVVVIEHAGSRAGLAVDRLHGERQIVVKPLGRVFQRVACVSGSALLGDGRVALILDVPGLMRAVVAGGGHTATSPVAPEPQLASPPSSAEPRAG